MNDDVIIIALKNYITRLLGLIFGVQPTISTERGCSLHFPATSLTIGRSTVVQDLSWANTLVIGDRLQGAIER